MKQPGPSEQLREQIAYFEEKRKKDYYELKTNFRKTGESLKPGNLVQSALQDVASNEKVKSMLKKAIMGLAVSFIAKRILSKKNEIPIGRTKNILQLGVDLAVSGRYAWLRTAVAIAFSAFMARRNRKIKERQEQEEEIKLVESPSSTYSYSSP